MGEALMVHARIIADVQELEALAPAWRALLADAQAASPFLTPTWLLAWWRQFGEADGRRLRVVAFTDGSELLGLAPLAIRTVLERGLLPVRRLELLGTGEPEAEEICSEYLGVISRPAHGEAVASELARLLQAEALGPWDELHLSAMGGEDPLVVALAEALRGAGIEAEVVGFGTCLSVALPGSWDAYLKALPSRHRYVVNRALRDFEKWAGPDGHVLTRAETAAQMAEGRRILHALHEARWEDDGQAGVFAAPRFVRFHDEVMPHLLGRGEDGRLDLLWLTVRGEPIAALYNVVHGGRVYFYQCGRRVDMDNGVRPGIVIQALAIRRAIDEGLREYDFLNGTSQYKRQLSTHQHPLVTLRAEGPGARARVVARARRLGRQAAGELRAARSRLEARVAALAPEPAGAEAAGGAPPTLGAQGRRLAKVVASRVLGLARR